MALPASGAISFSQINTELGRPSSQQLSLSDGAVRTLFGQGAGQVDLNTGHGKSNGFTFNKTISTNTTYYNIRSDAIANGWDGTTTLIATVTINAGVYVYSDNTATPAFDTGSTFPVGSTLTIINNGYIMGKGGAGGDQAIPSPNGQPGGPAVSLSYPVSINTTSGYILGGGGGGGGGGSQTFFAFGIGGGGGAGGGSRGRGISGFAGVQGTLGGEGAPGNYGAAGDVALVGGSGGRIVPSTTISGPTSLGAAIPGYGGSGGGTGSCSVTGGSTGGNGGGPGIPGGNASISGSGGGGGYGAAGGNGATNTAYASGQAGAGGAGGKAVNTNGYTVTWQSATTNVYGAVA